MTDNEIIKAFRDNHDEYCEFERVTIKLSKKADLHAFMLLDRLMPDGDSWIVEAANEGKIWIGATTLDIQDISENDIIELVRCGVYIDENDWLCMNV